MGLYGAVLNRGTKLQLGRRVTFFRSSLQFMLERTFTGPFVLKTSTVKEVKCFIFK